MSMTVPSSLFLVDNFRPESFPLEPQGKGSESVDFAPDAPKILVVDDERTIANTTGDILKWAGFRVRVAYDGHEALEAALHFRPDYLLSDVLMPKMNGVELALAILEKYPATKILLFSGQAGISEILSSGERVNLEFDLLAKPIQPLELIQRIKAL